MRLLVPMRRPFEALEEALVAAGCTLLREPDGAAVDAAIVDFCDAARRPLDTWRLRRSLGRATPLVAIARDAPWHKGIRPRKLWMTGVLGLVDVYATHSMQDASRRGRTPLYFPSAARLPHYGLAGATLEALRDPARYVYAVSFVGNVDADRYPEHRDRVEFLGTLARRLASEGIALTLVDSSRGLDVREQVRIIQSSIVNLNHGAACDQGGTMSWGLPERCYGIPAAGGFLLSDARRHARDDFVPEREWAEYADMDDCVAKVRHFVRHPEAARAIAEAAHARVMAAHTYVHRARTLMDAIARARRTP